jgi:putative aldouronate transport system permease protein
MIPFLILVRDMDLLDNFLVYIIPAIYGFTNMLIIRIAFEGVPLALQESARIDGASEWKIFTRIYLPLSVPALVTVGLFTAVFHWNDWFAGAYYVQSDNLKPAATILQQMLIESMSNLSNDALNSGTVSNGTSTAQTLQMALVVIILLPILCIYPFAQKYFVKGAIVGSIKE